MAPLPSLAMVPSPGAQNQGARGPAVRMEGLGRRFGSLWAMRGMDLELRAGEVFGLLGPNGAGKTTTVRLLTALISPSEGRAWVDGFDVRRQPEEVRRRSGILSETPGLYDRLTALQNLDFFARLRGLDATERAERIERFLRLFDLWERRDDAAGTFSKGMKQKLAIARALLHEPSVVFLDEPTAALDPEAAFVVREAIASLRGAGRTIVLCTHNLDEAERLCDRIAFVRGALLRVDTPARLRDGSGGPTIRVETFDPLSEAHLAAVRATPGVVGLLSDGPDPCSVSLELHDLRRVTPAVVRALVEAGAGVLEVREESRSLEAVYFEVMGARPQLEEPVA